MSIEVGEMAPAFALPDEQGRERASEEFAGRSVILFFYAKAMTPGCTTQACDFRDNYQRFLEYGYDILGISPDPPERNARFKEKEGLPFPLLSDQRHALAEAFGAWGVKKNYGREYEGLVRSTFVIDPAGRVAGAYRNVRAQGHVDRLARDLLGA